MALFGDTGTIFDSPWFFAERGAFERIAAWSDPALTWALILGAMAIVYIALNPRSPTLLKAVVLAYIVLP